MTFGLTAAGLNVKRLADVKTEIEAEFQAKFGANVNLDPESQNGQIIGVFAEREALLWELIEKAYAAAYRDTAEGVSLDRVVALAGIERLDETFSEVDATISGTPSTVVPTGSVASTSDSAARFALVSDATIGGGGSVVGRFRAEVAGPIKADATTLTVIETPVSGWDSVSNAADVQPDDLGREVETDAALRLRQAQSVRASSGSSADAVRAAVLRVDNVLEVLVFENTGAVVDADGRDPHSFEVIVRGGDDQEIADAIWVGKPAGIKSFGSTSMSVTDGAGDSQTVNFSRPTLVPIWVEVDLTVDALFPADGLTLVENEIATHGLGFLIGQDATDWGILRIIETIGIVGVTLRIGKTASPTASDDIVIKPTELADFDTSQITIVRLN